MFHLVNKNLHPNNNHTKNPINEAKTTWSIIKNYNGKTDTLDMVSELNLENGNIKDAMETACVSNKLFLSRAENLKHMKQYSDEETTTLSNFHPHVMTAHSSKVFEMTY
jgi:hypothetical protein